MMKNTFTVDNEVFIEPEALGNLLDALKREGYQTIGPTVHNREVMVDVLTSISDLPLGWHDEQDAGTYGLNKDATGTFFGYVVGADSFKRVFHPPLLRLWQAKCRDEGFHVIKEKSDISKYALIGVRSCDIHAIRILDRVFNTGEFSEPVYNGRRKKSLIITVNCTRPGGTCFCVSMNTGPEAKSGFDVVLTEVSHKGRHYLSAKGGSEKGVRLLGRIAHRASSEEEQGLTRRVLEDASR